MLFSFLSLAPDRFGLAAVGKGITPLAVADKHFYLKGQFGIRLKIRGKKINFMD